MLITLEYRILLSNASALEIKMVNWINRDRQAPLVATARVGVSLNENLPENYISPTPKHTLRWNDKLANAAADWADWNFVHGTITHEGDGTTPFSRAVSAGFPAIFAIENGGVTSGIPDINNSTVERVANTIHELFISHAGHRAQLFAEESREVGISIKTGIWNGAVSEIVFVQMATKKPINGDFNEDGFTNSIDFNILVSNYGKTSTPLFSDGNANGDHIIDTLDFNILAGNFGAIAPD